MSDQTTPEISPDEVSVNGNGNGRAEGGILEMTRTNGDGSHLEQVLENSLFLRVGDNKPFVRTADGKAYPLSQFELGGSDALNGNGHPVAEGAKVEAVQAPVAEPAGVGRSIDPETLHKQDLDQEVYEQARRETEEREAIERLRSAIDLQPATIRDGLKQLELETRPDRAGFDNEQAILTRQYNILTEGQKLEQKNATSKGGDRVGRLKGVLSNDEVAHRAAEEAETLTARQEGNFDSLDATAAVVSLDSLEQAAYALAETSDPGADRKERVEAALNSKPAEKPSERESERTLEELTELLKDNLTPEQHAVLVGLHRSMAAKEEAMEALVGNLQAELAKAEAREAKTPAGGGSGRPAREQSPQPNLISRIRNRLSRRRKKSRRS